MISILFDNYPFKKKYLELPLCKERMDAHLNHFTLTSGIEYIGVRNGTGPLSKILQSQQRTGKELQELNLLAYILTRFERIKLERGDSSKAPALEHRLDRDSYTLKELINMAYRIDGKPFRCSEESLPQLLQYERDDYGPRLDIRTPKPEPLRRVADMEVSRLYWMSGIDQFSDYQIYIRQKDYLLECPAWRNYDESLRFSEVPKEPITYLKMPLPSDDTTLAAADDELMQIYDDYMEGNPCGTKLESIESALLPEEFAQTLLKQNGSELSPTL